MGLWGHSLGAVHSWQVLTHLHTVEVWHLLSPLPAPPTLLGGYPYPTHSNKEILETLQAGKRLDKPKNCTQDM